MFAGVLPDIDAIFVLVPNLGNPIEWFVQHRGFSHWWFLLVLFTVVWFIYVIRLFLKQNGVRARDYSLTFAAITVAWASHLVLDFGFTSWEYRARIFEIDWVTLSAVDQVAALLLSALLAYLLWKRSLTHDTLV
jgi:hypothetical protein